MRTSKAILSIGAVMVDVVCHIPNLPGRGEGVVVDKRDTLIGGCAFNAGNIVRQLGCPCFLFAPIGSGIFADFARKELADRGLEALHVETDLDCGSCTCLVEPDGERTMVTSPGIERCFERAWFDAIDASRYGYALASGYEIEGAGGEAIISFLEAHPEIEFFYAPGPRIEGVGPEKTARINALRPVWHLNDLEAKSYTGCSTVEEAARAIEAESGNAVVITEGAKGASVLSGSERIFVSTESVKPVDTVGAGDSHLGALVTARSAGRSWKEALALANAVAGAVCMVSGASLSDDEFAASGIHL
ncbi:PfkB family carbohydrate kinase [Raoultibacter phocaeensis]|uniref:PfkB family carbohydrate kinase n=1 Tax=Raoultibacter phocaeensis TaxID=2479841 RepID=UPI001117EBAC|nr:PfkB family carbohydrate kinase [Raoultibacter phocaeensis]